jgi:MoaA/NifB/PqqE/SkfB family radical SAM enzyme
MEGIYVSSGNACNKGKPKLGSYFKVQGAHPVRISEFPISVLLDTTNVCNARCPFCPLFHGSSQFDRSVRPATVMPMDIYENLIGQIAGWDQRPSSLVHSANGEILQDPKILDRLAALKQHGLGPITILLTNGQYLDARVSAAILDANIGMLIIGFDGATKEVYESHRVKCNYDRVFDNIKSFVEMRDAAKAATKIDIKFVRTLKNEHEVSAAFDMFSAIMNPEQDRFIDALAVDWGDETSGETGLYYKEKVTHGVRRNSCIYYDNSMLIHPDGIVAACCWDYNLTISGGGLGKAPEKSLLEIWRGQKRADLGNAHAPGGAGLPEKCQSCIMMHEPDPIPMDLRRIDESYLVGTEETVMFYRFPAGRRIAAEQRA